jgi:valyl-tRNA synthetase
MQMQDGEPAGDPGEAVFDPALLSADDKHILARLQDAIRACNESLERFRFNDAAHALYEFVWHQFCDWYVEYSKDALQGDDPARRAQVLSVMHVVFSSALKLLHPMMPFVTEELFHAMAYVGEDDSIMAAPWPEGVGDDTLEAWGVTGAEVEYVDRKHEMIRVARTLRSDYGVVPTKRIAYHLKPHAKEDAARLEADTASLLLLLRAESVTIDPDFTPAKAMPSGVSKLATVYMPLEGLIDIEAEVKRLSAQEEKLEQDLVRCAAKLENEAFVSRAPAHVVERQRERQQELAAGIEKVGKLIEMLRG